MSTSRGLKLSSKARCSRHCAVRTARTHREQRYPLIVSYKFEKSLCGALLMRMTIAMLPLDRTRFAYLNSSCRVPCARCCG